VVTVLHIACCAQNLPAPYQIVAHFAGTRKLAFAVRSSKIQGKGAFAIRRIAKGAQIIEYLGECISDDEADIRYPDDEMGRHHTFLFAIGDGDRVLDAGPLDWPAKYINHSCDPNCEALEEEDGRVFISALKNIGVGTELLYDYAYERTKEHTEADEKLYMCRCGSPKCRGSIMAPPKPKKVKKGKKGKKNVKKSERKEKLKNELKNELKNAQKNEQTDAEKRAEGTARKDEKKAGRKAGKKSLTNVGKEMKNGTGKSVKKSKRAKTGKKATS
jgi:uncharacterized protein